MRKFSFITFCKDCVKFHFVERENLSLSLSENQVGERQIGSLLSVVLSTNAPNVFLSSIASFFSFSNQHNFPSPIPPSKPSLPLPNETLFISFTFPPLPLLGGRLSAIFTAFPHVRHSYSHRVAESITHLEDEDEEEEEEGDVVFTSPIQVPPRNILNPIQDDGHNGYNHG